MEDILKPYEKVIDVPMPKTIPECWNIGSLITYASKEGKRLRNSKSIEEHSAFLVNCAAELYPMQATWMSQTFDGCETGYQTRNFKINNKICEIIDSGEIEYV